MNKHYYTSESVTVGHPDKICDTIADSILDYALSIDPNSKMAVECTIKDDFVLIYGECNTKAEIPFEQIALDTLKEIGYTEEFHVTVKVGQQSNEINHAVVKENEVGAGDQGIMYGFACNETPNYMPLSIDLAHRLAKKMQDVRNSDPNTILKPDGKTQVTVEYEGNMVKRIDTIVVSTQHSADASLADVQAYIMKNVVEPICANELVDENTKYLINPSGSFVLGGSFGDSGTTGRKIVVDTYGGHGRIGGGCFSSKDPSKVDRSAAYYSRYVAKNIVAKGYASKCEIQVSYAIGVAKPLSVYIDTYGTNTVSEEQIQAYVNENFDFSVANIISELDLKRPIYKPLAAYGHFGRTDLDLPWEVIKK